MARPIYPFSRKNQECTRCLKDLFNSEKQIPTDGFCTGCPNNLNTSPSKTKDRVLNSKVVSKKKS